VSSASKKIKLLKLRPSSTDNTHTVMESLDKQFWRSQLSTSVKLKLYNTMCTSDFAVHFRVLGNQNCGGPTVLMSYPCSWSEMHKSAALCMLTSLYKVHSTTVHRDMTWHMRSESSELKCVSQPCYKCIDAAQPIPLGIKVNTLDFPPPWRSAIHLQQSLR